MDVSPEFRYHILQQYTYVCLIDCAFLQKYNQTHINIYRFLVSFSLQTVCEVNLAPSVDKMLSNCDNIIQQHKAACLRVTALLACKDIIWVGTSAGVLLTVTPQNIGKATPIVTGKIHYGLMHAVQTLHLFYLFENRNPTRSHGSCQISDFSGDE